MAKVKNFVKNYAASFKAETWELIENYLKAYPYTKDGAVNSRNKIINMCVEKKLSLPKMKKELERLIEEQNEQ